MTANCRICGNALESNLGTANRNISSAVCDDCVSHALGASDCSALLEALDEPVLLMQGNPRQVVTGNRKAFALFGKMPQEVEGHRFPEFGLRNF